MNTKMIKKYTARAILALFGVVVLYGIYEMTTDIGGWKYLLEGLLFTGGLILAAFLFSWASENF